MDKTKILVVEDNRILAVDIINSLSKLGCRVFEIIDSTEEAIKKVAQTHPNLVLMDISLSGEIDALQATHIIEKQFQIPVLYLTDWINKYTLCGHRLSQPFSYILTPLVEKDLHIAIKMALYKHQVENRCQETDHRLATIIESMGSAVVVADINGYIEIMNPLAEKLTGWKQQEVIGKELAKVIRLFDKATGEIIDDLPAQVMEAEDIINLPDNCALIAKDGTEILIGDNVAPIRDRAGNISGIVLVFQDISKRKQVEAHLLRNAFYDGLTGLPNRVLFLDRLRQTFERKKRRNNFNFGILFLDLDSFKSVNDQFGHAMGDDLLVSVARRLELCLRSGDTVARFGGDEFAVLLEDIKDVSDAVNVAKRIQESLQLKLDLSGHEIISSGSIGIALSANHHEEPSSILRDADTAMYRAKQAGKANYAVFS
jgi:diguanylate cyclase (GGDEF)-like protein/PAS domain S-box-containing protein